MRIQHEYLGSLYASSLEVNMIASIDYAKEHLDVAPKNTLHTYNTKLLGTYGQNEVQKPIQRWLKLNQEIAVTISQRRVKQKQFKIHASSMKSASVCLLALMATSSALVTRTRRASPRYCSDECSTRCAVAGVQDRCIEYCGICSEECKCVPSGNYGNKHECPCNKNKKGKHKRP
ncbi:hypothetical protein Prudu_022222 [Prunus dulcis]|uniref:Gibberellin-regulated family protein n=1 Tax=Prunus dulcis TaxID=3755 RepID=A0A4Y1RYZ9_PRUDU|nr:hypothetical protein Prudu_022222 [Prunus dulcis]